MPTEVAPPGGASPWSASAVCGKRQRCGEQPFECVEEQEVEGVDYQIGLEIAASLAISRIAMVHRLGRLQIGEASVSIIVTAPHRKPAFEAALEGINRLKRTVPIWKKEYFVDGEIWVEGEWDSALPRSTGA